MGVEEHIKEIPNKYKTREEQPDTVWANTEMDELRRTECLCFNCGQKDIKDDEGRPYKNCPVARTIFNTVAVPYDTAVMITRCGATDSEGRLLYTPLKPKETPAPFGIDTGKVF